MVRVRMLRSRSGSNTDDVISNSDFNTLIGSLTGNLAILEQKKEKSANDYSAALLKFSDILHEISKYLFCKIENFADVKIYKNEETIPAHYLEYLNAKNNLSALIVRDVISRMESSQQLAFERWVYVYQKAIKNEDYFSASYIAHALASVLNMMIDLKNETKINFAKAKERFCARLMSDYGLLQMNKDVIPDMESLCRAREYAKEERITDKSTNHQSPVTIADTIKYVCEKLAEYQERIKKENNQTKKDKFFIDVAFAKKLALLGKKPQKISFEELYKNSKDELKAKKETTEHRKALDVLLLAGDLDEYNKSFAVRFQEIVKNRLDVKIWFDQVVAAYNEECVKSLKDNPSLEIKLDVRLLTIIDNIFVSNNIKYLNNIFILLGEKNKEKAQKKLTKSTSKKIVRDRSSTKVALPSEIRVRFEPTIEPPLTARDSSREKTNDDVKRSSSKKGLSRTHSKKELTRTKSRKKLDEVQTVDTREQRSLSLDNVAIQEAPKQLVTEAIVTPLQPVLFVENVEQQSVLSSNEMPVELPQQIATEEKIATPILIKNMIDVVPPKRPDSPKLTRDSRSKTLPDIFVHGLFAELTKPPQASKSQSSLPKDQEDPVKLMLKKAESTRPRSASFLDNPMHQLLIEKPSEPSISPRQIMIERSDAAESVASIRSKFELKIKTAKDEKNVRSHSPRAYSPRTSGAERIHELEKTKSEKLSPRADKLEIDSIDYNRSISMPPK